MSLNIQFGSFDSSQTAIFGAIIKNRMQSVYCRPEHADMLLDFVEDIRNMSDQDYKLVLEEINYHRSEK